MFRALVPLVPLALLAACSSSSSPDGTDAAVSFPQPAASSFQAGPCRTVADQLLGVGRDARELGDTASPPVEVRQRLKDAQDALDAVRPELPAPLATPFSRLVVTIGLVRLQSDGNSYDPATGTQLSADYEAAVQACTT